MNGRSPSTSRASRRTALAPRRAAAWPWSARPCRPRSFSRRLATFCGLAAAVVAWCPAAIGPARAGAADETPDGARDGAASADTGDSGATAAPLTFTRVHVPAGRLADVPLGTARYVPMSAREFEEGIASLYPRGPAARPLLQEPGMMPLADATRYAVTLVDDGGLEGTLSCDVGLAADGLAAGRPGGRTMPGELTLGRLEVRTGTVRTGAGLGEAVVFGRRDGAVALVTGEPGTYTLGFRLAAEPGGDSGVRFRLPLVPALTSTITLRLPRGIVPLVGGAVRLQRVDDGGAGAGRDDTAASPGVAWRIDTGPRDALELTLVRDGHAGPPLTLWTEAFVGGRQAELVAAVRPRTPWLPASIRLVKDPAVRVVHVAIGPAGQDGAGPFDEPAWSIVEDGRGIVIDLPRRAVGGRDPIVIRAVAPIEAGIAPLPLVRLPSDSWSGGGIVIHGPPSMAVASIDLAHGLVVSPEAAALWPLPQAATAAEVPSRPTPTAVTGAAPAAADSLSARLFVEEQGPDVVVRLALLPREADLDVARVTTVDLSPGVVVGRAMCEVRVPRGDVFGLTGRITPGWFIDSVEAVPLPTPADAAEAARRRDAVPPTAGLDWRVQRDARGDMLRIGLATAATPARPLGLRITGHRTGMPLGEAFTTADIDMVRLDGEGERSALLDLRTSPEATVEFEPAAAAPASSSAAAADGIPTVEPDGRLAVLVEEGAARARLRAGFRAESRTARLVRRRPPLDARTEVRVSVRDDRLTESLSFECHPAVADLDSIVVQFSAPLDDPLEWSLLPPAVGSVSARRLDASDRRGGPGGGERWLVELNPPARAAVTIRASRTLPFVQATPLLLAWVDGSTSPLGRCVVRNVGRTLPRVLNRRLAEVPPEPEPATAAPFGPVVAEFSFDGAAAAEAGEAAAAELIPGSEAGRAWVCRETTFTWCHASGVTEHETSFSIDNHGRPSVLLTLPPGQRVQGMMLDGIRLPLGERAASGGPLPIELPPGRSLVHLLVRTVVDARHASGRKGHGAWSLWAVEAPAITLDVPVLQREWRLLLPPGLDIALGGGLRSVEPEEQKDWVERLAGASVRWGRRLALRPVEETAALAPTGGIVQGYRGFTIVPQVGRVAGPAVVVVGTRVVSTAAACVGLAAAIGTLLATRASFRAGFLLCLLAGVAALWTASPLDGIARAGWWGTLAAVAVSASGGLAIPGRRGRTGAASPAVTAGLVTAIVLAAAAPGAAAETTAEQPEGGTTTAATQEAGRPLQVFITPQGGAGEAAGADATVLVPEELFRAIVRGEEGGDHEAARVLDVRVETAAPGEADGGWPVWRLNVLVDADAGGGLVLDQSTSGGRFSPGSLRIDGAPVVTRTADGGERLRVVFPDAGRHTVTVGVVPASRRLGDVETATIAVPVAPAAAIEIAPATATHDAAAPQCDAASRHGVFQPAPRLSSDTHATVFDISRAHAVRLVRATASGHDLATLPPIAVSRNDIFWNLDECRLTGVYEVDAGDAVVRSCVVRADAGLEWIEPAGRAADARETGDAVSIVPLGNHRYLVERRRPERGRFRFEISFRLPLADPVGVFDVPEAWLEETAGDTRTVRFVASPSLAVQIDLPAGMSHTTVPDGEASFETRFWRDDRSRAGAMGRPRLTSSRRQVDIRSSQRETVVFAAEQVRMHLDARIDASATALVTIPLGLPQDAVVDRIVLSEDDVLHPEAAGRGAIDLRWSRAADATVTAVVQRPRAGRFRLEVDARMPGRPPRRGPLPCIRLGLADGARTLVEWWAEDGLEARLERVGSAAVPAGPGGDGRSPRLFELAAGEPPPAYVLAPARDRPTDPAAEMDAPPSPPATAAAGSGRVELADIRVAMDERGRAWGVASFDVMPAEETVRIQLPRSWRLFDALVDGRPVEGGTPSGTAGLTVWEVRLHGAGMPRTIVALFHGELFSGDRGQRLLDGEPIALSPPQIVGLPCRRVIWTLQMPPGLSLRVAAPARPAAAADLDEERRAAQGRLEEDFRRAIEASAGWRQERVRAFAAARLAGVAPDADAAWFRAVSGMATPLPAAVGVVSDGNGAATDGGITIRAVRQRDATVRGRAIATLALLSCGGLLWLAIHRAWAVPQGVRLRLAATAACTAGAAWLVWLAPSWPGAVLVGAGLLMAARGWPPPWRRGRATPPAAWRGDLRDGIPATTVYRP